MKKILILFCFLSSALVNAQIIRTPQTFLAKATFLDSLVAANIRALSIKIGDGYVASQNFVTRSIHDSIKNIVTTEHDPIFSAHPSYGITSGNISNWNTAYNLSHNHSNYAALGNIINSGDGLSFLANDGTYKLINLTESDPVFVGSPSHGITQSNINSWNSLVTFPGFGTTNSTAARGDHLHTGVYQPAGSYLTTESDPVYSGSASAGISSSNITAWNNKLTKVTGDVLSPDSVWVVVDNQAAKSAVTAIPYGFYTNITGVGNPYTLTTTSSGITLSTVSPAFTVGQTGTWKIQAGVYIHYVGATVSTQYIVLKVRRNNNTAVDLISAPNFYLIPCTAQTGYDAFIMLPPFWYSTSNATDVIQIWGSLSDALSQGSIQVTGAWITAEKIYD